MVRCKPQLSERPALREQVGRVEHGGCGGARRGTGGRGLGIARAGFRIPPRRRAERGTARLPARHNAREGVERTWRTSAPRANCGHTTGAFSRARVAGDRTARVTVAQPLRRYGRMSRLWRAPLSARLRGQGRWVAVRQLMGQATAAAARGGGGGLNAAASRRRHLDGSAWNAEDTGGTTDRPLACRSSDRDAPERLSDLRGVRELLVLSAPGSAGVRLPRRGVPPVAGRCPPRRCSRACRSVGSGQLMSRMEVGA
jgi:hypothetical protein